MKHLLWSTMIRKLRENKGQAMSEYGLILAIVAIALISALVGFRTQLITMFTNLANTLQGL